MKLRRYIPVKDGLEDSGVRMARFDDGAWVRADDVDALLARIREAVEVEREFTNTVLAAQLMMIKRPLAESVYRCDTKRLQARAALDALLADGGA